MKHWKYNDIKTSLSVASENPLLAKLLAIRNIDTDEKVEIFLNPEKKDFIPFSVFKDSEKVIQRIKTAVEKSEKIVIYGDFDTDGVTSTAILYKTLKLIGADVTYYLPDRDLESHGLNSKAVLTLIAKQKAKLIITVDCGVSNVSEVKLANSFNTDVIITDHHEAPEILPEAFAIINPKAKGVLDERISTVDIESLCYLAGAGISFKLATAILDEFDKKDFVEELIPIAALGTIGDIVPLVLENRRIAYTGIKSIKNKVNKGITRLFENAGVKDFSLINSETVAFTAVPRLNATGRLDKADIAFKLLVSDDEEEIDNITHTLNDINSLRQNLCDEAFNRAQKMVEENQELYKHAIVLCDEDAHVGVLGLSASKLVETYSKPAFIMRKDGNKYRCSCRGLKGVNIYEILNENSDLFLGFGGHEFAGGFSFDSELVSFEKVQQAINNTVFEQTNGEVLPDILNVDLKLSANDISLDLIETISKLEPFGANNPMPIFSVEDVRVSDVKFMGQNKNHLKLFCSDSNGKILECIKWSVSSFEGEKNDSIKIAFTLELNKFNGNISVQLMLKDFQLQKSNSEEEKVKIIDCRFQKGGYDKIVDFLKKTKKSVAIFTENETVVKYFMENNFDITFDRNKIPKNMDMIIFVDVPPSLDFIKKVIDCGAKEILLMNYDEPFSTDILISKFAGMLKYVFRSLSGKTNLLDLRKALLFDDNIIKALLELFASADMLAFSIDEKGNISLNNFHPVEKDKIIENALYVEFEKLYKEYYMHIMNIKNYSLEELKNYILK